MSRVRPNGYSTDRGEKASQNEENWIEAFQSCGRHLADLTVPAKVVKEDGDVLWQKYDVRRMYGVFLCEIW